MSSTGTFDPFKGVDIQTKRYRAHCRILVAGVDVTDRIEPHLISVKVVSGSPFTAEIELDDRDARLPAPPMNAPVNVELGWASEQIIRVFNGSITKKESAFQRKGGGRRMFIHAEGPDWASDIKTPFQDTLGTGTEPGQQMGDQHSMADWLKQVSGSGGGSAVVSPGFGGVTRDHWQQNNTSPVQVFQELAQKFGGMFNIDSGNRFLFLKPGEGGGGTVTGNVIARWGDNIISWRIELDSARSTWQGANQQFFDTAKAQWDKATQGGGSAGGAGAGGGVQALPAPAPNSSAAQQDSQGLQDAAGHEPTKGIIVINGEPLAQWNGNILIIGARPGVDGLYVIESAEHFYSRQGYITTCHIMRPGAGSGAVNPSSQG